MFLFRERELFLLEYLLCTYLVILFILKKKQKNTSQINLARKVQRTLEQKSSTKHRFYLYIFNLLFTINKIGLIP